MQATIPGGIGHGHGRGKKRGRITNGAPATVDARGSYSSGIAFAIELSKMSTMDISVDI
jgi:hypothetical protein